MNLTATQWCILMILEIKPNRLRVLYFVTQEAYNGNDAIKDDEGEYNTGRWTHEEHEKFLHALKMYGKEWKKVQEFVGTRSSTQARSHAQKFFSKMGKGSCSNSPHKKDLSYKTKKSKKIIESQEKAEVFKVSENTPDTYTSKVTLNISEIDYLNTHPYRRLTFNEDELDSHFYSSLAEEAHMSFDNYSDFKYNEEPMFTDCFESILK